MTVEATETSEDKKLTFPTKTKRSVQEDYLTEDGKYKKRRKKPKGQKELLFESPEQKRWQQEHI